ncbi:MAG: flagellar motor switch protein FliN [Bryobacteraceae bacterium]
MKVSGWLAGEWARQFGPALSSMTGEPLEAAWLEAEPGVPPPESLRIVRRLRGSPDAVLWIAASPDLWQGAGRAVLRAAGLPDAGEAEVRDAFAEVLQQSLGQLAIALGQRLGREVEWEEPAARELPHAPSEWATVEVTGPGGKLGRAWVAASPGLFLETPRESRSVQAQRDAAPAGLPQERRPMLDLLMEVELPVGVTFGRTQLKLKDAIKLTSGSIVELNRSIIEPVEVIVNNCVIARGEVVVIEGNYGVRIQQIVSREERLRTLF